MIPEKFRDKHSIMANYETSDNFLSEIPEIPEESQRYNWAQVNTRQPPPHAESNPYPPRICRPPPREWNAREERDHTESIVRNNLQQYQNSTEEHDLLEEILQEHVEPVDIPMAPYVAQPEEPEVILPYSPYSLGADPRVRRVLAAGDGYAKDLDLITEILAPGETPEANIYQFTANVLHPLPPTIIKNLASVGETAQSIITNNELITTMASFLPHVTLLSIGGHELINRLWCNSVSPNQEFYDRVDHIIKEFTRQATITCPDHLKEIFKAHMELQHRWLLLLPPRRAPWDAAPGMITYHQFIARIGHIKKTFHKRPYNPIRDGSSLVIVNGYIKDVVFNQENDYNILSRAALQEQLFQALCRLICKRCRLGYFPTPFQISQIACRGCESSTRDNDSDSSLSL